MSGCIADLDTPALLIDLDAMEHNIQKMAAYYQGLGADLRPHMKTHKTPIITHKQIEAGAIGVTCQKLGEAEIFARAGIRGILISNQIVGPRKIARLVDLSKWADMTVGVEELANVQAISKAAQAAGARVNVAIEIYMGRCGVEAGEGVAQLAREIVQLPGVKFRGIWSHDLSTPDVVDFEERKAKHHVALEGVIRSKHLIEAEGIDVEIVSCGFSATWNITPEFSAEITDVQVGSYVLMDWPYQQMEGMEDFQCALTVLTTVMSKNQAKGDRKNVIITDCGIKSIATEHTADYSINAFPKVKDLPGAEVIAHSEEHGLIQVSEEDFQRIQVGDTLELIPPHCCGTCNLHDQFYAVRGDRVDAVWPIEARGAAT
ncbi:MAG: DSD1 family PLP-dependent enzyme [Gemmatimonadetes bacterium]|jgi:D-serine deaminase-like pyridoxal phosphate-dependent protein|nr:DSD1 family PLP-dependent enzyme [Gemmatimonadota bacterium]MBT5146025.1 DSD1 family PLP-dependent enzyme [Gemmatimonadota bacterium]MBT5591896.1 DSD1 family PLP-dependent enzyme [Gemmatimonadota bacterium]MBT5961571.1 DSD1 family PLP-dependent enzyme [Gemmatimonadota bacterium]MBT6627258.1 DSD1 family PLP-dependent enzyme [Gemmatimonadota bacterium]